MRHKLRQMTITNEHRIPIVTILAIQMQLKAGELQGNKKDYQEWSQELMSLLIRIYSLNEKGLMT
jgi:hypothetical protein